LPGPITPQQLDLLPAHLIEYRQAALEAPAELWEPPGEVAGPREPPDHVRGAVILVGHERENLGAPTVGPEQRGVLARDVQIDVREGLLHFVDDQPEQTAIVEHPLEQRLAPAAADLEERRQPRAHAIPARDEVAVLRPGEHPGDGPQVGQSPGTEAPGRPRPDVQEGNLFQGTGRLEVRHETGMVYEAAIGGVRRARERLHRFVELPCGYERLLALRLEGV